jgi:hypothetical protein
MDATQLIRGTAHRTRFGVVPDVAGPDKHHPGIAFVEKAA